MSEREAFIRARRSLFWSVDEAKLPLVSDELLVETILNYGSLDDVRGLISLLGIGTTAETFRRTSAGRRRGNYQPPVANFFKLYFDRHAPENPVG